MSHYSDQTETKVGQGLKGLYKREHMPKSGWKVTDDHIRRQLKATDANMPPFSSKGAVIVHLDDENLPPVCTS